MRRNIKRLPLFLVGITCGLTALPSKVPLLSAVQNRQYLVPPLFLVGTTLLILTIWPALLRPLQHHWVVVQSPVPAVALFVTLSTMSAAVVVASSGAAFHPSWCPAFVCPPPPPPVAYGPHDSNLEVRFKAFEATAFVLPGEIPQTDPSKLPQDTDPSTIVAHHIGDETYPYGLLLHLRNVASTPLPVVIEGTSVRVVSSGDATGPTHVWDRGARVIYGINPYDVQYAGEPPPSLLAAKFAVEQAGAAVELQQGEADDIVLRFHCSQPVDLRFKVVISYLNTATGQVRELELPTVFHVVFADDAGWLPIPVQAAGIPSPGGPPGG